MDLAQGSAAHEKLGISSRTLRGRPDVANIRYRDGNRSSPAGADATGVFGDWISAFGTRRRPSHVG